MDPDLLADLVDKHATALELYAAQWSRSPADLVQDAFVRLIEQDPLPRNIVPWLYRVVRNAAISEHRTERRRRKRESLVSTRAPGWFADSPAGDIDAGLAEVALSSLSPEQSEIIVARIWGGLSFGQIGEAIGVSSSSAHRRYQAGLDELRKRLVALVTGEDGVDSAACIETGNVKHQRVDRGIRDHAEP